MPKYSVGCILNVTLVVEADDPNAARIEAEDALARNVLTGMPPSIRLQVHPLTAPIEVTNARA